MEQEKKGEEAKKKKKKKQEQNQNYKFYCGKIVKKFDDGSVFVFFFFLLTFIHEY